MPGRIRIAHSRQADAAAAVQEFYDGVAQSPMELVVFFCSSDYDLDVIATELCRHFVGVPIVGCTTAGEIGPAGYSSRGISGASFPSDGFSGVSALLQPLQGCDIESGRHFAENLMRRLEAADPAATADNSFGFLLIDGLSAREEAITLTLQNALGRISMVGGSAGDDLKFQRTWIFHDGAFHTDCAALMLLSTRYPFRTFKTQHFVSMDERIVVTAADAERRVVKEINGLPAAEEYARLIGVPTDQLAPSHFAANPVVVRINGMDYVRSIQQANADGSLTFYCAIDEGVVFRLAQGKDLIRNLKQTFDGLREEIGKPQAVFACDCVLRNLEISQNEQKAMVGELLRRNNTVGFSTYGEQYAGVHVNQTFTGIAIGEGESGEPA
ncbi:MAG TPA: nitric oxide-sensing protein NosP [Rhodocyclaceae bacterium]